MYIVGCCTNYISDWCGDNKFWLFQSRGSLRQWILRPLKSQIDKKLGFYPVFSSARDTLFMCTNYTSSGLTNIGNILPQIGWQSNTPLLKTVTVMVVVVGAQKKDRFHLLRDLWEIMGGRLCPSFLEKKISVRSSYRVLLSTVHSQKKVKEQEI